MALYHGEYDSSKYSSSFANIHGEDEESLLLSYRTVTSYHFRGAKAFRRCCVNRERDFIDGSSICNEYILFTRMSLQDMTIVDKSRRSLSKMCFLYDVKEEVLVVKLMVGVGHEHASIQFMGILLIKLANLGLTHELIGLGSARFGDGRRQKEADQSFKPLGTHPNIDDWPSLTFEVGFSESLSLLRNDACFWLTRSQLQTNIVVVIHIDKVERQIEIEWWEVINTQCLHRTTVQYPPTVGCLQRIELKAGNVYMGLPLELSVEKVFDIVPPNLVVGALDFTPVELQAWNDTFWRAFP